jgi:hypothetical protein
MQMSKPVGLTQDDMIFLRKMLIAVLSSDITLSEEDAIKAARLIHRFGRLPDAD